MMWRVCSNIPLLQVIRIHLGMLKASNVSSRSVTFIVSVAMTTGCIVTLDSFHSYLISKLRFPSWFFFLNSISLLLWDNVYGDVNYGCGFFFFVYKQ